jgi:drug/metabolite transporter (DMT)-like permease
MQKETKGMLLALVGIVMFSLTLPMTKHAVQEIDPIWLAFARAEVAALLGGMALLWFKVPFPARHLWPQIAWSILGVVIGFPLFTSIAMRHTDASHGAIITGLLPIATATIATITSKVRPSFRFWLSAMVGAALVVGYALWQSKGSLQIGDAAMLVAVLLGACGYAFGGKLSQAIGGWQTISWVLVCAAPLLIVPLAYLAFKAGFNDGLLSGARLNANVSWQSWAAFAYVSVFSQLVGFFFWYGGMAIGGVARVSQVQLLQLFFTLSFAWAINGESVSPVTWLVCVLVAAVVVVNKRSAIS